MVSMSENRKVGRPSKFYPDVAKAIIDNLSIGATYKDASEAAGVSYYTFLNWLEKGEKAKSGKYYEFFKAVERAKATARLNYTKTIAGAAAKGDWRAALEYLKRHDPESWGDSSKLDLTSDGEAINLIVKVGIDPDKI